jgi:hypothetical protein
MTSVVLLPGDAQSKFPRTWYFGFWKFLSLYVVLPYINNTMAPSATETTTLPSRTNESSTVRLTGDGLGEYKELAPIGYDKEAEEKGVGKFAPASVRSTCLKLSNME